MATVNTLAQTNTDRAALRTRVIRIAANALLLVLWLWLYRAMFDYLAIIFSQEDFRTNQIVLVGVIVLIAIQLRNEHALRGPRLDTPPQLFAPALILVIGGSVLYLIVERFLDINTISASLFGLASYGLLGLWMSPRRWWQGIPAALLVIGVLPFGEHMQTFIGYPMRILTASIVRDGLASAGVASIGVDTILVFENGISQVDVPCSGVKSLWTGALFLLAATWVERRALNWRWLLVALAFAVILFITNLARVGALVVVGQVLSLRLVAEMMHVPLGVLSFVAACAAAVGLLRFDPANENGTRTAPRADQRRFFVCPRLSAFVPVHVPSTWLSHALAFSFLAMGLLYEPRPPTGLAQLPPTWDFAAELVTQPMPLKRDEVQWLTRDGAESADRRRFEWRGISGSIIFITSATWRAHHRPERCFEVYGLTLDDSRTHLVAPDFPVRFVALGQRLGKNLAATYWFQSADRVTDDYGTRMWSDVASPYTRWVLVSILFDRARDPNDGDMQSFYLALRDGVAQSLK